MFIKVKRALYSASCCYCTHTHTNTRTRTLLHTHSPTLSLLSVSLSCSLTLLLSQAVCPHGNEGCSNNNDCKVINTLCKKATKKKKTTKHSAAKKERRKKQSELGWAGLAVWVGGVPLGACLFLCRVVTAASSCSLLRLLPLPRSPSLSLPLRVASHFLH